MAPDNLPTLKSLSTLQLLPSIDCTHLDANHVLIAIIGRKVSNGLCLLDPRVPDNRVVDAVPLDVEVGLVVDDNGSGILLDRLVDTVGLAGDADGGVGLLVLGSVEDLVDVAFATETVDSDL